jgi:hypothetical protein
MRGRHWSAHARSRGARSRTGQRYRGQNRAVQGARRDLGHAAIRRHRSGMRSCVTVLSAMGIGRPDESHPIRPHQEHLFRSAHLTSWPSRTRFGWALGWDGPHRRNAVGVAGADWAGGNWLGGGNWHKHGLFVVCRWRRRGSLRSDRRFAKAMGCPCPRSGLLWPIGSTRCPVCPPGGRVRRVTTDPAGPLISGTRGGGRHITPLSPPPGLNERTNLWVTARKAGRSAGA